MKRSDCSPLRPGQELSRTIRYLSLLVIRVAKRQFSGRIQAVSRQIAQHSMKLRRSKVPERSNQLCHLDWRASNATCHNRYHSMRRRRVVMADKPLHSHARADQSHPECGCCDRRGDLAPEGFQPVGIHHAVPRRTLKDRTAETLKSVPANETKVHRNTAEPCP